MRHAHSEHPASQARGVEGREVGAASALLCLWGSGLMEVCEVVGVGSEKVLGLLLWVSRPMLALEVCGRSL